MKDNVEKLKTEISCLTRETKKYEESITYPNECPTCGKPLLPEFKVCPCRSENIKLRPEEKISMRAYK